MLKIRWKQLLICLAIPLAVGGASAFLTRDSMKELPLLRQPPLSPPMWVFPVVWTVLFLLMGLASYQIYTAKAGREETWRALTLYGGQLAVNFVWPLLFFRWNLWWPALAWLVLLWGLILGTTLRFYRIRTGAGMLLIPYLLWVAFAGYLNAGIAVLN